MARRQFDAWVPRYGTVRSFVLFGLFVVVVAHAGADAHRTVATATGVQTGAVARTFAVGLWLLLTAVVALELRRQTRPFPSFIARDVREQFLSQRVPQRALFAAYVLLLLASGYVAVFARPRFFAALDGGLLVVRRLVETGDPGAFSLAKLGYGLAFVVGSVAVAHAADRVLVAGARALIAGYDED
jgi:hypothetical protein